MNKTKLQKVSYFYIILNSGWCLGDSC